MRDYEIVDAFIDQWEGDEFSRNDLADWADITPRKASQLLQEHRLRQLAEIRGGAR